MIYINASDVMLDKIPKEQVDIFKQQNIEIDDNIIIDNTITEDILSIMSIVSSIILLNSNNVPNNPVVVDESDLSKSLEKTTKSKPLNTTTKSKPLSTTNTSKPLKTYKNAPSSANTNIDNMNFKDYIISLIKNHNLTSEEIDKLIAEQICYDIEIQNCYINHILNYITDPDSVYIGYNNIKNEYCKTIEKLQYKEMNEKKPLNLDFNYLQKEINTITSLLTDDNKKILKKTEWNIELLKKCLLGMKDIGIKKENKNSSLECLLYTLNEIKLDEQIMNTIINTFNNLSIKSETHVSILIYILINIHGIKYWMSYN